MYSEIDANLDRLVKKLNCLPNLNPWILKRKSIVFFTFQIYTNEPLLNIKKLQFDP